MGRTAKGLGFLLLVAVLGAGCGSPQPSPQLTLSIANETSIAVGLVVNGSVVATVPAGVTEDPVKATLPALPWTVEARSPSGRTLETMIVRPGDTQTMSSENGQTQTGDVTRVLLGCGRLAIWAGPEIEGPYSPVSDDCH
jgi:hypothetical protein